MPKKKKSKKSKKHNKFMAKDGVHISVEALMKRRDRLESLIKSRAGNSKFWAGSPR